MKGKKTPKVKCAFCEWKTFYGFGTTLIESNGYDRLLDHIRTEHSSEYEKIKRDIKNLKFRSI